MSTFEETDTVPADPVAEAADLLPTGTVTDTGDAPVEPLDLAPEEAADLLPTGTAIEEPPAPEPVDEPAAEAVDVEELLDAEAADAAAAARPPVESPYDRPGRWYVVHSQSGYENKVRQNLGARTASMHLEDRIHEIVIPMEDVVEFRNGKKVTVSKKMFPGYLLVRCSLDDITWAAVRDTPGIVNFVGSGGKPLPLSRREVETFLQVEDEATASEAPKKTRARFGFDTGETVRVKEGPFADFSGEIIEINEDQLKVKVLVNIFGRETPVELEFSQVAQL